MSTHGSGTRARSKAGAQANPKAVVTRTATENGTRWHHITITRPDGSEQHVRVNADVFPTRPAAKAEALRYAEHGYDRNYATVPEPGSGRTSYEAEATRLAGQIAESSAAHQTLAKLAAEEGLGTVLTRTHQNLSDAIAERNMAAGMVVRAGRSKQRIEAEAILRDAQARVTQGLRDLAMLRGERVVPTAQEPGATRAPMAKLSPAEARAARDAFVPGYGKRTMDAERAIGFRSQADAAIHFFDRFERQMASFPGLTPADRARVAELRQVNASRRAIYERQRAILGQVIARGNLPAHGARETVAELRTRVGRSAMFDTFIQSMQDAGVPWPYHSRQTTIELREQLAARTARSARAKKAS